MLRRLLLCVLALVAPLFLAFPALAQDTTVVVPPVPVVGANPLTALLVLLLPVLAGWLSNLVMDGLKQITPFLDRQPDVVKKVLAVLVAFGTGVLASKFGVALDADFHQWTAGSLTAVFTVLVQQGFFRSKTNKNLAAQGLATKEQQADSPAALAATVPAAPVASNR